MVQKLKGLLHSPTFTTWLSYFAQFGSALILLPLLLIYFDDTQLSLWFLLYMLMGLSLLADAGFGPTIVRIVSFYNAGLNQIPNDFSAKIYENEDRTPNFEKLNYLLNNLNTVYLIIGLIASIIIYISIQLLTNNLVQHLGDFNEFYYAVLFIVLRIFFSIQQIKWSSFLCGTLNVPLVRRTEAFVNFLKLFIISCMLPFGAGLNEIFFVELICTLFLLLFFRINTISYFSEHNVDFVYKYKFDKSSLDVVWTPAWKLGLIQIGGFVSNYGSSIIVAQIVSPSVASSFMLTQRLILFLRQVSQAPLYANLPNIYKLFSEKNLIEVKFYSITQIRKSIVLLLMGLTFLFVFGNVVINYLFEDKSLVEQNILALLCLGIFLEMHHAMHSQVFMGTNKVPFLIPSIISSFTFICVGFLVSKEYGLLGVVLVQLIVQALCNNWYPVYLNLRLLNVSFFDYLRILIRPRVQNF